ncbi:hypothetical protein LCM10_17710 [Rossellomorea aquimaris]|uniref:hypothetical protein n=1 Tax=Rossellomorea aquimaris TaxID=189382 RepID=UPI001CD25119|nr:hypothetical protein [Rossellomorea aquimaris]MCA1056803.1 hypothetical protein [Rossellomorea aquimaris]
MMKEKGGITVNVSSIMGKQVAELQHTLSMNLLKSQMSTQAANVTVMLRDMQTNHAPHPTKGQAVDLKG